MARDSRAAFLVVQAGQEMAMAAAFRSVFVGAAGLIFSNEIEAILSGEEPGLDAVKQIILMMGLDIRGMVPLTNTIADAFAAGGNYQAELGMPPRSGGAPRARFFFEGRNPRADEWVREQSARLVSETIETQRDALRSSIDEMFRQNLHPRRMVTTIVGRREGSGRVGGLIGLHSRDAMAVIRAKQELRAGDFNAYRSRLTHAGKQTIAAAERAGRALTEREVERLGANYADALLRARGRRIARTESNKAMNAGKYEALRQMVESGRVQPNMINLIWESTPGNRTRDSHKTLNKQSINWGESFVSPLTGATLKYPHDENAPASETVNCRCSFTTRINWAGMAK